jgi:hypothetical protein
MRWRYERWVKLYTKEEGSFAQLPLYVRALAAMLLKLADQDGCIHLGGKEPWLAIAFQLGADASDRRLLRKHLPVLIADGYLVQEGHDLFVRNFTVAQTGVDRVKLEPSATETRLEHEPCANEARVVRERCTTDESTAENQAGPSCRSDLTRSEEEEEGEKEHGQDPAPLRLEAFSGPAASPPRRASRRRQHARALPSDWSPRPQDSKAEPGVSVERELGRFRDHAIATDRRLADWDAGWRMWLSKAYPERRQPPGGPRGSGLAVLLADIADHEAQEASKP